MLFLFVITRLTAKLTLDDRNEKVLMRLEINRAIHPYKQPSSVASMLMP